MVVERAEAIRNKPPTRAQVRNKMITYLKHMESNKEAAADYEQEKEELRIWLAVVPEEDEIVDPEILSVKQDLMDLHRLVMKRFEDNTQKGYYLLLWGDLKLEADAESTMAFKLLKFIKSQFRGGLLGIMNFYNLMLLSQLDTAGDVPLDLSKDTKPYIKLRSSRSVHWDQQVHQRHE
ncbi:hypothetical protein Tco_1452585, partial [Tanacetum coccineum]